jgi:asparagine synthase (glutamine-hydrolysing)
LQALRDVFSLGFVTGPKTLFTEIRRLPPAHYLLYEDGRAGQLGPYWRLPSPASDEDERRTSAQGWAERLREKLQESVRLHLRSDVPVGAWLSPGVDSSSIAALASGHGSQPLQTFSLGFEDSSCDEVGQAPTLDRFPNYALSGQRVVCRAGDFALLPEAIWHTEDVMAGATAVAGLLLAKSASERVKVVLTGEGSDELFGGYPWYKFDPPLRPFGSLPLPFRQLLVNAWVQGRWPWASRLLLGPQEMGRERYRRLVGPLYSEVWQALLSPELRDRLSATAAEHCLLSHPSNFESWHSFTQLQYYDMNVRLPSAIVHQLDRASMAHSVEARVPFLDHELVELCARIPVSLKLRGGREKYILRQAMRRVLPAEIVNRPKRWLSTPNAAWLRGKLPDFALEVLSDGSLRSKGYFSPEPVARLLERHRAGRANHASQLLGIIGIQLWDELFVRGCRAP